MSRGTGAGTLSLVDHPAHDRRALSRVCEAPQVGSWSRDDLFELGCGWHVDLVGAVVVLALVEILVAAGAQTAAAVDALAKRSSSDVPSLTAIAYS